MSKKVNIYCEGMVGSLDDLVLNKLIAGLPKSVTIKPIGSKKGAEKLIKNLEKENGENSAYLFFRDRDYDYRISETPALVKEKSYIYLSHRITIENYLFDTQLFYQYLIAEKLIQKKDLLSEEKVKEIFVQAAQKIKYYQAVRHTISKMRITNKTNTTWKVGSGVLPKILSEEHCCEMAWDKIMEDPLAADRWKKEDFDREYQEFIQKFDDSFFDRLDFFVWFQGKDFATILKKMVKRIQLKKYYKLAVKNFDYTKFEDLKEFRRIIESKLE